MMWAIVAAFVFFWFGFTIAAFLNMAHEKDSDK